MKPYNRFRFLSLILIVVCFMDFSPLGGRGSKPIPRNLESPSQIRYALDAEVPSGPKNVVVIPSQQYVAHEPIHITNNADFAAFGFPGAGTQSTPYIIEGLNITSAAKPLISIENTTTYFLIRYNYLNGVTGMYDGIWLGGARYPNETHGTIDANIIRNCETGIELSFSWTGSSSVFPEAARNINMTHNVINNCGFGIGFSCYCKTGRCQSSPMHNTVAHNIISNCGTGIALCGLGWNILTNNTVAICKTGISFGYWSSSNTATHNNIVNNTLGISCDHTSGLNTIIWNDFRGNNPGGSSQASDNGGGINVFAHNYWEDHDNTDLNGDGIADTLYLIEGAAANEDPTPLVVCATLHCLSKPTLLYPIGGETLKGTVSIQWAVANDSWDHSVTYAVLYSTDNGSTWISVTSELQIPSYEWDTTTVEDGPSYWLKVVASCSEGLTAEDVSDIPFIIQNPKTTTTTLVGAFSIPGGPTSMLFAIIILILVMIPVKRVKRKYR